MKVAAIVLAAGAARRMGRTKQLLRRDGESLLRRAARAAVEAGCAPVLVVLPDPAAPELLAELEGLAVRPVLNGAAAEGIASSIRAGIDELRRPDAAVAAVLLLVCDQPDLDAEVLRRLLAAHDGSPERRIGSAYAGVVGVPALFGRRWFDDLAALRGDRGARELLRGRAGEVRTVCWPAGAVDLDSPDQGADYED